MCYDFLQGNHRGLPCETTSEQQIKGREENILKVLWGGQYSNGNGVQSVQVLFPVQPVLPPANAYHQENK